VSGTAAIVWKVHNASVFMATGDQGCRSFDSRLFAPYKVCFSAASAAAVGAAAQTRHNCIA
jgi:hypothetical protein